MEFKRQPFAEKMISEINPEKDINVCITGRVLDIDDRAMVIDDGTGKAGVFFTPNAEIKNLSPNDIVRLFGYVVPNPGGFEIRCDIVQLMNGLDMELFKRIRACY